MKRKIQLKEIAHGRSGDKGNVANIGLIAKEDDYYEILITYVTVDRVKEHLAEFCLGKITRFELPNIHALNFVLEKCLDGGGTVSLRTDAQGKTLAEALLRMEIEV